MYALTLSAKRTVCLQNKLHLFPQKPQINEATTILQKGSDFRFEQKAVISKHSKGKAVSRLFAQLTFARLIEQRSCSVSLLIDFICAIASNTKSRSASLTQECFLLLMYL